jgi:hypothetical protein
MIPHLSAVLADRLALIVMPYHGTKQNTQHTKEASIRLHTLVWSLLHHRLNIALPPEVAVAATQAVPELSHEQQKIEHTIKD